MALPFAGIGLLSFHVWSQPGVTDTDYIPNCLVNLEKCVNYINLQIPEFCGFVLSFLIQSHALV